MQSVIKQHQVHWLVILIVLFQDLEGKIIRVTYTYPIKTTNVTFGALHDKQTLKSHTKDRYQPPQRVPWQHHSPECPHTLWAVQG